MKKSLLSIGITSLLFINGCATYVKVRMLKPSEFNVGSVRKIAISEFKFNGNYSSNDDHSIASIAANALVNAITGNNNNSSNTYSSYKIKQLFLNELSRNGHFKIIEKNNFLPINDYDNSLEKLNQIKSSTDAEAILTGNGNYSVTDNGEWIDDITYKDGIKITNKKYRINRRVETSLSYRFINISTGEILASKTNSSSSNNSEVGTDQESARHNLNDWKNEINQQIESLTEKSVKQIAPYYVYEDREVKEGKSYIMKSAFKDAQLDKWEEAKFKWENVVKNKDFLTQDSKEDFIFSKYNLGIYYEINGEPEKSELIFQECYDLSKNYFYIEAKGRAITRKYELERLKKQNIIDNKN